MRDETETLLKNLQRTVGRQQTFTDEKPIGRAAFRMYADAVDDPNPLYTNPDAARKAGLPDVIAPPTLLTDTFRFYGDALDESGLPAALDQQSPGTPIRAGNSYRFFQRLHPSDIITATRKVTRVWQKHGRSGPLTFQEVKITYRNQHNDLLTINTEVLLYRKPVDDNGSPA